MLSSPSSLYQEVEVEVDQDQEARAYASITVVKETVRKIKARKGERQQNLTEKYEV